MIFNAPDKCFVCDDSDAGILLRIALGHFERAVSTAVVDNNVLPIGVFLCQYAFDALGDERLAVIDWRYNAY